MGFGFRKSFGSGPFRFTVSPSGVSSSFGVRGARISSGPRGTFVTVSSHGIYYRHRIDQARARHISAQSAQHVQQETILDSVFQVPVAELADSNQSELVTKLNENVSATNPAIFVFLLSCVAVLLIPSFPVAGIICILVGFIGGTVLYQRFKAAHTHEIHYSLDSQASEGFAAVQSAVTSLSSCNRVWALNTRSATSDQKRNAGAGTLITRKPASIGTLPTAGFKPSLAISSIGANGTIFHFLPDQILLFSGKRYAAVPYDQLRIEVVSTRFIETDGVPRDSTQVGTTWRFVNKNGGPDRRFNNNAQIPILQYGEVVLHTDAGLQVILQTSSLDRARSFASLLRSPSSSTSQAAQAPGRQSEPRKPSQVPATLLECYALLGIPRPCTSDQASAAHRHKAGLYHPDKYEHLAPDMKALAAAKMQEINAAYSRIKSDQAH